MRLIAALFAFIALTLPALAREFRISFPVDCTLGEDCFFLQNVDADPGPGAADFTCNPNSYDGHKGTDIALTSFSAMAQNIPVLAVAPGKVTATRDGMPDRASTPETLADIEGKECGNGVMIDHGGGWTSQYCHLKSGSVAVQRGQRVPMGAMLGAIGLSGKTQFPHLHLVLRKNNAVIDPFDAEGVTACGTAGEPTALWLTPIEYAPTGIVSAGLALGPVTHQDAKAGIPPQQSIPENAPALVGWALLHNPYPGDLLTIEIRTPAGKVSRNQIEIEKKQVLRTVFAGKKLRANISGPVHLSIALSRNGAEIESFEADFPVTPE
ncbi:MAG: peptidase M24 [Rhodobacterales bacterium]|nr:MAG: peptidase M24 [Rhodobacterales bacterium]